MRFGRISTNRPLLSYTKIQNLYSSIIRGKRFQLAQIELNSKEYLNVGCGLNLAAGFINLDYHWYPGVDICWDITQGFPFENKSMVGIYTEHCLEHVSFSDCSLVLTEFRRLLVPGGMVRIVVPDTELYLDLYQRAKSGDNVTFPYPETHIMTPMMYVNRIFRNYGHLYAYDAQTLAEMLSKAGFTNIQRVGFMIGRDSRLLIDSEVRAVESLYIEASSP